MWGQSSKVESMMRAATVRPPAALPLPLTLPPTLTLTLTLPLPLTPTPNPTQVDLLLLAQCTAFVGKFTSNFYRAAYALHAAGCECAAPFVSLDAPWCFDYGLTEGRNWDFPFGENTTGLQC